MRAYLAPYGARGLAVWLMIALGPDASSADGTRPAARFAVRVKTQVGSEAAVYVPVGEVVRKPDGAVAAQGMKAPALDRLTDKFVAEWSAFKPPAAVVITDEVYSDTGMRPTKLPISFTFTEKDALYKPAVLRHFAETHKYKVLGLGSIKFSEHDTSPGSGRHVLDEAQQNYNFRKGTTLEYSNGQVMFFISTSVRPANNGAPMGVLRVSATDANFGVFQDHDDGTQELAYLTLQKDGRFEVTPRYAGEVFESDFGRFTPTDLGVSVITKATDYKQLPVKRTSPHLLEAYIVQTLEHQHFYDVLPKIDPVLFR